MVYSGILSQLVTPVEHLFNLFDYHVYAAINKDAHYITVISVVLIYWVLIWEGEKSRVPLEPPFSRYQLAIPLADHVVNCFSLTTPIGIRF